MKDALAGILLLALLPGLYYLGKSHGRGDRASQAEETARLINEAVEAEREFIYDEAVRNGAGFFALRQVSEYEATFQWGERER